MLDDRKSAILRAVVQQYIESAQPVGSSIVASRADVAVSPATVRNDMTLLESEGYLTQPHTSAGRIPTEKGYRFFVDSITAVSPGAGMSPTGVRRVKEFFASTHGELEQMLAETSRLLSDLTGSAAVVIGEPGDTTTIRSVNLVELSSTVVLAVMVLSTGVIVKKHLEFPEDIDTYRLQTAQRELSELLEDATIQELSTAMQNPPMHHDLYAQAALTGLHESTLADLNQMYVDGRSRIASSFEAKETLQSVLGLLEQQLVVVSLLKELIDSGISVVIGSESGVSTLADCSLVVAPYAAGGEPAGAVAVLGPTRMNYGESLSAVAVVSQKLSRMLTEGSSE